MFTIPRWRWIFPSRQINPRGVPFGTPPPFGKNGEKGLYNFLPIVYDTDEQSRRPRVKCHRDGELPGGRRNFSAMGSPHPLLHIGKPPLCSNDTRSGKRSAVYSLPFEIGFVSVTLPTAFCRGVFAFMDRLGRSAAVCAAFLRRIFLWQESRNPQHCTPILSPRLTGVMLPWK